MTYVYMIFESPLLRCLVALILVPAIGTLLCGLDRKLTARLQGRIGPSFWQPVYDILKLLGKQPFLVHRMQLVYAFLHLFFMMLTLVLLVLGQDLLMVLFCQAFSALCLVIASMSVRSPYSWIGSQRKILQMLAYEPTLILLILAVLAGLLVLILVFVLHNCLQWNKIRLLPKLIILFFGRYYSN